MGFKMKKVTCPRCGKKIAVADNVQDFTHKCKEYDGSNLKNRKQADHKGVPLQKVWEKNWNTKSVDPNDGIPRERTKEIIREKRQVYKHFKV